jgi:hypothetical protein
MKAGTAAVCGVVLICVFIGVYGWLAIRHIDTAQFLYVFGTIISVNTGILFNIVKTSKIQEKVEAIQESTNGTLEKLLDKVDTQQGTISDQKDTIATRDSTIAEGVKKSAN